MALAIYRKYRPALFADLVGQELVVRILRSAAAHDALAHAYLFAGPRGTGKTTTARLIAKIANCERRATDARLKETGEPCNECSSCRGIDEGRSLDVIEIDAASNRGIDEIRNLRENVRVAPSGGRSKVFIIDEAHQLTKDAWNALLKTLEEPPEGVRFVLATTESDRIPATILSRTQQFYFRHIPLGEITKKLSRIAIAEKAQISPEAIELIASAAEGSFRDAESLFDQLTASAEREVSVHDVERAIGRVGFDALSAFAGLIIEGKTPNALLALADLYDRGHNVVQFTKDLIQYLRRVALLKANPKAASILVHEVLATHLVALETHALQFTPGHLSLLKRLIAAYADMRYSQFPIIPLEIALMESNTETKNPRA